MNIWIRICPFFKECMAGICEEASQRGYDIIISLSEESGLVSIQRLVMNRKVDGIILTRTVINSGINQVKVTSYLAHLLRHNGMPEKVLHLIRRTCCAIMVCL